MILKTHLLRPLYRQNMRKRCRIIPRPSRDKGIEFEAIGPDCPEYLDIVLKHANPITKKYFISRTNIKQKIE